MDYISVKDAADKWRISQRRVQKLCETGKVDGAHKFGLIWLIPKDVEKPIDGRKLRYQSAGCKNNE